MNEKIQRKLQMLLCALLTKMENPEYFKSIFFYLRKGQRDLAGEITYNEEEKTFYMFLEGEYIPVDGPYLLTFVMKEVPYYHAFWMDYIDRSHIYTIDANRKDVKMTTKDANGDWTEAAASVNPLLPEKEYLLKPSRTAPLLKEIGIMTEDGKIKNDAIRKYTQIDRFLELISDCFEEGLPEPITILDCACGKSYLSFAINYYLHEILGKTCHIIGIDRDEHVIEESKKRASRLGLRNMTFVCKDLGEYTPTAPIHMLVSLHACDTATDMAMSLGVKWGAKNIICVPCCHAELRDRINPKGLGNILKYGPLRAHISDALTDGLRALKLEALGFNVNIIEYISPLDSPKNLMIKAKKAREYSESLDAQFKEAVLAVGAEPAFSSIYLKGN